MKRPQASMFFTIPCKYPRSTVDRWKPVFLVQKTSIQAGLLFDFESDLAVEESRPPNSSP
jgi:hypothetical protein